MRIDKEPAVIAGLRNVGPGVAARPEAEAASTVELAAAPPQALVRRHGEEATRLGAPPWSSCVLRGRIVHFMIIRQVSLFANK